MQLGIEVEMLVWHNQISQAGDSCMNQHPAQSLLVLNTDFCWSCSKCEHGQEKHTHKRSRMMEMWGLSQSQGNQTEETDCTEFFHFPNLLKQSHFSESAGLRVPGSNHKYCLWPLHVLQRIAQRKYLGTTSCAVQAWHLTPPPACWAPAAPLGALRTPSVPAQLIPAQASRASLQLCERKKFQGKSGIEIEVCTQSKAQHCSRNVPGRAQSRGQGSEPICRGSTGRAPAEPRAGTHVRRSRGRSQRSLSRILAWPGEMSPGHRDEQQWARTPALPPGSSSPLQSPKAGKIWDKYLRVRRCSWASGARAEHGGFGVASAKAVAVALFFFFSWTIQMH